MKFSFFNSKKGNSELDKYLQSLLRNAVLLKSERSEKEPNAGASKIGGIPHLPDGFEWPYYGSENYDGEYASRPLSFIAQIDLCAFSSFDRENLLPKSGYLYFFYDIVSQKWGFDPADSGCARVYYFDITADKLRKTPLPQELPEEARVPLSKISFKSENELPSYDEFCELTDISIFGKNFNWKRYDKAAEKKIKLPSRNPEEICKLLGYADIIQDSMIEECAQVTSGIYCGDSESHKNINEEQKAAIEADKPSWILLAQFGTLSDDIMFGDCGCIYFYIRKEDLAAGRFDRVWLCLQCG